MSNDVSFVLFDPAVPGDIGGLVPANAKFVRLDVCPEAADPYGERILVTDASTHGSPQGALKIDMLDVADPNPALNINHLGMGPDIQLASGVTLKESGGELFFTDGTTGTVSLFSLTAAGGGGVNLTLGRVIVNAGGIPANTTVTSSNTTQLTDAPNGLVAYLNSTVFVENLFIYLDGQLMANGVNASSNNDVYAAGVASNGEMAFEFDLAEGSIITIMRLA